ncbi:MAG: hypothetical protein IKD01_06060 [Oscillospiraceae bacterium]|nr:hypothetical protein [Oscillospiraceae bacterium]
MAVMFLLIVPFGGLWTVVFQPIVGGGGVDLSPIYPIYAGIILLAGLIVGCTIVILEEIRSLKKINPNNTDKSQAAFYSLAFY